MQIYDYVMAIVTFVLSLTIYEIFTTQIKCQKFDIEVEAHDQRAENEIWHHSTGNVRCDFFSEFYLPRNIRLPNQVTYTYTHTYSERQGTAIGKIFLKHKYIGLIHY